MGFGNFESFEESFYALDPECRDVPSIFTYDMYISTVIPLDTKQIRYVFGLWLYYNIHVHVGVYIICIESIRLPTCIIIHVPVHVHVCVGPYSIDEYKHFWQA